MATLTVWSVLKMTLEVVLGFSIKLYIENGRIAWEDFANDFLFWLPGVERRAGDGLSRQVEDLGVSAAAELAPSVDDYLKLAAK